MSLQLVPGVPILPVVTTLDVDAERVLKSALQSNLKGCIVIGTDLDGKPYFASTWADGGDVLWQMKIAELRLMGVME